MLVAAFGAAMLALVAFSAVGDSPALLFALLFAVALCTFGAICMLAGPVVTEAVPPSLIASAAGIPIGAGEIFGGGIAPIIGGFVAQNFGIQNTLYVALAGLLIGLAISLLLNETAPAKTGEPTAAEPVPASL